jgi:hypothetical protein
MSTPLILLTDTHGCFYTMLRLLNACPKPARVILLGDLIDRGPHSRKVVEWAMRNAVPTCCGNHEDLALAFYKRRVHCANMYARDVWLDNGGDVAVRGWPTIDRRMLTGPQAAQAEFIGGRVPDDVLEWMERLPAYIIPDAEPDANGRKLLASHTGYGLAADRGDWFRALWGRHAEGDGAFVPVPRGPDEDDGDEGDDGYYRVYGHTAERQAVVTETWAMIDTGAAYGSRGLGTMTALIWPTKQLITQPYDETPCTPTFTISAGGCIG